MQTTFTLHVIHKLPMSLTSSADKGPQWKYTAFCCIQLKNHCSNIVCGHTEQSMACVAQYCCAFPQMVEARGDLFCPPPKSQKIFGPNRVQQESQTAFFYQRFYPRWDAQTSPFSPLGAWRGPQSQLRTTIRSKRGQGCIFPKLILDTLVCRNRCFHPFLSLWLPVSAPETYQKGLKTGHGVHGLECAVFVSSAQSQHSVLVTVRVRMNHVHAARVQMSIPTLLQLLAPQNTPCLPPPPRDAHPPLSPA